MFNFYVKEIVGKEVFFKDRNAKGRINDIVVNYDYIKPKAYAVEVDFGGFTILVDFSSFDMIKEKEELVVSCNKTAYIESIEDNSLFISKHVLDKKVMDSKGVTLEKVKDIEFVNVSTGTYVVGARLGYTGLLAKAFASKGEGKLISWDEVEKIDFFRNGMKISKDFSSLPNLKQSDILSMMQELQTSVRKMNFA